MEAELSTISVKTASEAVSLPDNLCSRDAARRPSGVAAFDRPSRFAVTFALTACIAAVRTVNVQSAQLPKQLGEKRLEACTEPLHRSRRIREQKAKKNLGFKLLVKLAIVEEVDHLERCSRIGEYKHLFAAVQERRWLPTALALQHLPGTFL